MSELHDLGHRHLLPIEGLAPTPVSPNQTVRIVLSDSWAVTRGGQLLVTGLVNLLCRQVGLVGQLEVLAAERPLLIPLPGPQTRSLLDGLSGLAAWASNNAITVSTRASNATADMAIIVGGNLDLRATRAVHAIVVLGDGWRAWVGTPDRAPPGVISTSSNPLGPLLAAALAAGEVFKRGFGLRRGRHLDADGYSLWTWQHASNWAALIDGPEIGGVQLPSAHVVGVGAVGNAVAYTLAYAQLACAYLILIDDDIYDARNLNRCLLAGWNDLGEGKIHAVSKFLKIAGVPHFAFDGSLDSYLIDARGGLRPDIAEQVNRLQVETVLSCVDKGVSRQAIQRLHPRLLMGGSTFDLQAKVNGYGHHPGARCLACFNPSERHGEVLRALERKLRAMAPGERASFLTERGLDPTAIEAYLTKPECGGIGEAALKDFATRPPPQFSAGFVSLTSGLLLAAAFLRESVYSRPEEDMVTVNFQNGALAGASVAADPACEQAHSHRRQA